MSEQKICECCNVSEVLPGWEICQSCAYAIKAYAADGNWNDAPEWLKNYTHPARYLIRLRETALANLKRGTR